VVVGSSTCKDTSTLFNKIPAGRPTCTAAGQCYPAGQPTCTAAGQCYPAGQPTCTAAGQHCPDKVRQIQSSNQAGTCCLKWAGSSRCWYQGLALLNAVLPYTGPAGQCSCTPHHGTPCIVQAVTVSNSWQFLSDSAACSANQPCVASADGTLTAIAELQLQATLETPMADHPHLTATVQHCSSGLQ
jgi:hypothetical protein